MIITLPWPPSINRYWRSYMGRVLISREGRAYRKAIPPKAGAPFIGSLSVAIHAMPPDRRRRDLDNILKCLLDGLQHAGYYADDNQIDRLTVERGEPCTGGFVVITLEANNENYSQR